MPFTGEHFRSIFAAARTRLRDLLCLPANYRILFMQGGASAQFSLLPLNLLPRDGVADYVESGHWARRAISEARRYGIITVAASGADFGFNRLPDPCSWRLRTDAAYCHITPNETANGLEYPLLPETGEVPLVADMTSSFLSRPFDMTRFGLVYAGAQKNIGPAGLTIVIVREDLLDRARAETPTVFTYRVQAKSDSMVNTPLTYAIYLAGLVFEWLESEGGLVEMARRNGRKSRAVYDEIDRDGFYHCRIPPSHRSRMNVCFGLADPALEERFLSEGASEGLINLKGHNVYGALRASLYNAMPEAGVAALVEFMVQFRQRYG
jgi:phosphoserine aminotransferase